MKPIEEYTSTLTMKTAPRKARARAQARRNKTAERNRELNTRTTGGFTRTPSLRRGFFCIPAEESSEQLALPSRSQPARVVSEPLLIDPAISNAHAIASLREQGRAFEFV